MKKLANKRAVSPVIAVVLLIALTVAAVAVVWNIIDVDGPVSVIPTTTSASGADGALTTWQGVVTVSKAGDLNQVYILHTNGTSIAGTITTGNALNSGDNSVTVTFDGSSVPVGAGTYNLQFTFLPDGNSGNEIVTISVPFAA